MYTTYNQIFYYNSTGWAEGPVIGIANKASFSNDGVFLIINNRDIGGTIFVYKFDGTNWNSFQTINAVTWCGTGGYSISCHFNFVTNTTFLIYFHLGKLINFTLDGNAFVYKTSITFMDAACQISRSGNGEVFALINTTYSLNIFISCPDLCSGGCSGINYCASGCTNGTILIAGTCACPEATTMSTTTQNCVSCNISFCTHCDTNDYCKTCSPPSVVSNGSCTCPYNTTFHNNSGCITCAIAGCSYCN
jgi:hypothetical protein